MAVIYASLIQRGIKTIYDVPESIKDAVWELLEHEATQRKNAN